MRSLKVDGKGRRAARTTRSASPRRAPEQRVPRSKVARRASETAADTRARTTKRWRSSPAQPSRASRTGTSTPPGRRRPPRPPFGGRKVPQNFGVRPEQNHDASWGDLPRDREESRSTFCPGMLDSADFSPRGPGAAPRSKRLLYEMALAKQAQNPTQSHPPDPHENKVRRARGAPRSGSLRGSCRPRLGGNKQANKQTHKHRNTETHKQVEEDTKSEVSGAASMSCFTVASSRLPLHSAFCSPCGIVALPLFLALLVMIKRLPSHWDRDWKAFEEQIQHSRVLHGHREVFA